MTPNEASASSTTIAYLTLRNDPWKFCGGEEDGSPREGIVDGEVKPAAAAGQEEATAVAAAEAPLVEVATAALLARIDIRDVFEEDVAIGGGGRQVGLTGGGADEVVVGAAVGDGVAAVGQDEADERGAAEREEAPENGGVGSRAAPALAGEGGVDE